MRGFRELKEVLNIASEDAAVAEEIGWTTLSLTM
jgi:hypothetical protein